jgi:hypothetical protein
VLFPVVTRFGNGSYWSLSHRRPNELTIKHTSQEHDIHFRFTGAGTELVVEVHAVLTAVDFSIVVIVFLFLRIT